MENVFLTFVKNVVTWLLELLPNSPYTAFIEQCGKQEYLKYLNWFVPISSFIARGESLLTCIAVYYLYQMIMRKVDLIS